MCGCAFNSRPPPTAARSIIRAKPAVVNGVPRSLTKTKGDGTLSRCRRRSAGSCFRARDACCGFPFLTRTCSTRCIEVYLVPAQVAHSSAARKPCRNASRITVQVLMGQAFEDRPDLNVGVGTGQRIKAELFAWRSVRSLPTSIRRLPTMVEVASTASLRYCDAPSLNAFLNSPHRRRLGPLMAWVIAMSYLRTAILLAGLTAL